MRLVDRTTIERVLDPTEAMARIEAGFVAYSAGRVTVPPVGHLDLPDADGECHIKYGWIRGDEVYLIKIASGFYGNPALGLPSGNGLMLLFSARTGEPLALLQDEGWLTDVRTAMAGAISARYLAPRTVERIGIVGSGIQAGLQLRHLASVTDCRDVQVWARRPEGVEALRAALADTDFRITTAPTPESLCAACNVIVTTTPAKAPLLQADWIRPGTHVTAMGSDGAGKQELDPALFAKADLCVVDSRVQCTAFGEASFAVSEGHVRSEALVELGAVIAGDHAGRTSEAQITLADLTGVAVQDIAIAGAVWAHLGPDVQEESGAN